MIRLSLPMLRFYFSFYWFFCSNVNTISKSIILHYSCDFFLTTLLALCLFITQPCFFFIFHQVVPKPFKFINNGLQANKSLANRSNFPSFLSLCIPFRPSRGKVLKQFLYNYQYCLDKNYNIFKCCNFYPNTFKFCAINKNYKYQYQCILIFSVIWLEIIRLKCNSVNTKKENQCKKKTNRKT